MTLPHAASPRTCAILAALAAVLMMPVCASAQFASQAQPVPSPTINPEPVGRPSSQQFQGSVVKDKTTNGVLLLSLPDAMARGLKYNLGLILQGAATESARGQRLQALQPLLPTIFGNGRESVSQVDLAAEGLRFPGLPQIIGPYGTADLRASLTMALINVPALENFLAAKHNFASEKLSMEDARDMVVLTVGNAYLIVIADAALVSSAQAQVDSSKLSLDQAVANHQAGISPQLDELRARVDYQTQQQTLINAQNMFAKDKIALARVIGLPLEQEFTLTDAAPYSDLDTLPADQLTKQALEQRKDLAASKQDAEAARRVDSGAHAERLPSVGFTGDYGVTGPTFGHSHGTGEAIGVAQVPIFEEAKIEGDEHIAAAQKKQNDAKLSNAQGQVAADVQDSLLDLDAAKKSVAVAHSNVQLAAEALYEAQERFKAGVADNLAVVQAQASVAQANQQYVSSLYQHNLAKLELARALGIPHQQYLQYLGGK
jgi:outer membrane protein TolC